MGCSETEWLVFLLCFELEWLFAWGPIMCTFYVQSIGTWHVCWKDIFMNSCTVDTPCIQCIECLFKTKNLHLKQYHHISRSGLHLLEILATNESYTGFSIILTLSALIWFLSPSISSMGISWLAIWRSTFSSHLFSSSRFSLACRNFSCTACCTEKTIRKSRKKRPGGHAGGLQRG